MQKWMFPLVALTELIFLSDFDENFLNESLSGKCIAFLCNYYHF